MNDLASWSLSLGRWGGIQIRLHALFVLLAIGTLYLSSLAEPNVMWIGYALIGLLFVSVLLHELGHCYAAFREGGDAEQIVIGPLGGMAPVYVPHDPRAEFITALAGPTVNFGVSASLTIILLLLDAAPHDLLHPLSSADIAEQPTLLAVAKLALWINWMLMIVSFLPAFPFDGGRMLRCLLWRSKGFRTSMLIVAALAKGVALVMLIGAVWIYCEPTTSSGSESATPGAPLWAPLAVLSVCLYFSAKQEVTRLDRSRREEESYGFEFASPLTRQDSPVDAPPSLLAMWRQNRRRLKEERRRETEQAEEARVDEILARLHASGLAGLPPEDRAILQRVSARYRNRQGSS